MSAVEHHLKSSNTKTVQFQIRHFPHLNTRVQIPQSMKTGIGMKIQVWFNMWVAKYSKLNI